MTGGSGSRRLAVLFLATAFVLGAAVPSFANHPVLSLPTTGEIRIAGRLPLVWPKDRMGTNEPWAPGSAPLIVDPSARRGFVVFSLAPYTKRIGVLVYDLDSYRLIRYVTVSGFGLDHGWQNAAFRSSLVYAVDEERHRLFIATQPGNWTRPLGGSGDIVVLDEKLLEAGRPPIVGRLRPTRETEQILRNSRLAGMSLRRDPIDGRLKALAYYVHGAGLWITYWDADRAIARFVETPGGLKNGAEPVVQDWGVWPSPYRITSCRTNLNAIRGQVPVFMSSSGDAVFTGCTLSLGSNVATVRIHIGLGGIPDVEEAFVGPKTAIAALPDPASDRLHIVALAGRGQELWTFDGHTRRWVGRAGLSIGPSPEDSFGIDANTGRVYALLPNNCEPCASDQAVVAERPVTAPGGLFIVEGRLTPLPQAVVLNEFAYPSVVPIVVVPRSDAHPTRIFVRRSPGGEHNPWSPHGRAAESRYPRYPDGKMVSWEAEQFFLAIEDRIPHARLPELGDADSFTVDVAQQEGVTGSTFEGSGGAYAVRLRLIRGFRGAAGSVVNRDVEPACWSDDRSATFGHVEDGRLTTYQASARAAPATADPTTGEDIASPFSRCQPRGRNLASVPLPESEQHFKTLDEQWSQARCATRRGRPCSAEEVHSQSGEFSVAECVGDTRSTVVNDRIRQGADLSAEVSCAQGREAGGEARTSVAAATGVRVADSWSKVEVKRDQDRGIVATSESHISGLSVVVGDSEILRIDAIHARAESWSNGRPFGRARASLLRSVCGIHGPGVNTDRCYEATQEQACAITSSSSELPEQVRSNREGLCGPDELTTLADILNRALFGQAKFRVPAPEHDYLRGSPGGYAAGVRKSTPDYFDDTLLNGDFSYEVPTLQLSVERDDGRHVFQFAAVRAITTYGIFCLPPLAYASRRCVPPQNADDETGGNPSEPSGASPLGPEPSPAASTVVPTPFVSGETPVVNGRPHQRVIRILLLRSAREGALASAVWFALLLPAMLAARRRRALGAIRQGETS